MNTHMAANIRVVTRFDAIVFSVFNAFFMLDRIFLHTI